jgi:hypothetical protein
LVRSVDATRQVVTHFCKFFRDLLEFRSKGILFVDHDTDFDCQTRVERPNKFVRLTFEAATIIQTPFSLAGTIAKVTRKKIVRLAFERGLVISDRGAEAQVALLWLLNHIQNLALQTLERRDQAKDLTTERGIGELLRFKELARGFQHHRRLFGKNNNILRLWKRLRVMNRVKNLAVIAPDVEDLMPETLNDKSLVHRLKRANKQTAKLSIKN